MAQVVAVAARIPRHAVERLGSTALVGGADDDGVVAAPAVRVGVLVGGGAEERTFFFEELDDDGVGFEDGEVFVGLGDSFATICAGVALEARCEASDDRPRIRIEPLVLSLPERCPSGRRSATGNRVGAERCLEGSNPFLSAQAERPGSSGPRAFSRGSVR